MEKWKQKGISYHIVIIIAFATGIVQAHEQNSNTAVRFMEEEFPWDLVIDRGKIYGCIYESLFYSEGSILIEETLPRKCEISAARDGFWSELDERELELYKASKETQKQLESESTRIGDQPITKEEAGIIRYMRRKN